MNDDEEDDDDDEEEDDDDEEEDEEEDDDDDEVDTPKKAVAKVAAKQLKYDLEKKDKETIEGWTKGTYGKVLFDSNANKWTKGDSEFAKVLNGKKNVLIIVEDSLGNKFGGFVGKKVKKDKWVHSKDCFIFLMRRDGKSQLEKYDGKTVGVNKNEKEWIKHGFKLFQDNDYSLFSFGDVDMEIKKKNASFGGSCHKTGQTYDYKGKLSPVCDYVQSHMLIKRVVAVQMNKK